MGKQTMNTRPVQRLVEVESAGHLGVYPRDTLASAGSYVRTNPSDFLVAHNEQDLNPAAAAKAGL